MALAIAAWLLISTGRDVVADQQRIDELLSSGDVAFRLSSTNDAVQRAGRQETSAKSEHAAALRVQRETARRQRDAAERAAALLAAVVVAVSGVACVGWRRTARERDALACRLQAELHHDSLTGLPNRRFFSAWLSFAIAHARRESAHVGVLFVDVSGCPAIAELHGVHATDALLIEIARRFRATSREGDVFARLDASQFALATPNARDMRELGAIAQRLRDALNDPAQPPLADTPVGVSIGIAFYPEDAGDSAGVIAAANAAMYSARRAGRNHIAFNAIAA